QREMNVQVLPYADHGDLPAILRALASTRAALPVRPAVAHFMADPKVAPGPIAAPARVAPPKMSIARLPATGSALFGRLLGRGGARGVDRGLRWGGQERDGECVAAKDGWRRVAGGGEGLWVVVLQPGDGPADVIGRVLCECVALVRGSGSDARI